MNELPSKNRISTSPTALMATLSLIYYRTVLAKLKNVGVVSLSVVAYMKNTNSKNKIK